MKRSSETLLEIANYKNKSVFTYQEIVEILGERAFGIAILFFSLPSALPFSAIPSVSLIFSIPIVFFAVQMVLGRQSLWLPQSIAERTISQENIAKMVHTTAPYLAKIESFLRPRLPSMTNGWMDIFNGVLITCLALLLMLPIPFSNFIFAGLLILLSLGLIEKDGLFILMGYLGAFFYLSFIYMLIRTLIKPWLSALFLS